MKIVEIIELLNGLSEIKNMEGLAAKSKLTLIKNTLAARKAVQEWEEFRAETIKQITDPKELEAVLSEAMTEERTIELTKLPTDEIMSLTEKNSEMSLITISTIYNYLAQE